MKPISQTAKLIIGSVTLAFSLTSLAQNTNVQKRLLTEKDVAGKLQQYVHQTEDGMIIRPTDAKLVWAAAKQFKGKSVSLELPKTGDTLASNSVLIGSGQDALVSDNNLEKKGNQYILNPPFTPKTSITLVGRAGNNQYEKYCLMRLSSDENEKFLCLDLNIPFRIQQGNYLLNYQGMNLKVSIKENENKMIYLREIFVPKQIRPITFRLKMHLADSEQINNVMFVVTKQSTECTVSSSKQFNLYGSHFPKLLDDAKNEFKYSYKNTNHMTHSELSEQCYKFRDSIPNLSPVESYNIFYKSIYFSYANDNSFISVLPGIYNVEWTIDEQTETTEIKID